MLFQVVFLSSRGLEHCLNLGQQYNTCDNTCRPTVIGKTVVERRSMCARNMIVKRKTLFIIFCFFIILISYIITVLK
jgi:hypothetical protein